ncbi:MAG: pseudouridine synthase [Candidatus Cryptobacteroides sp.]
MENNRKGGFDRNQTGDRREYGDRQNRPRRPRISSSSEVSSGYGRVSSERRTFSGRPDSERRNYGQAPERRSYGSGERRGYGSEGERRGYGSSDRNFGSSDRSYGSSDRNSGERRSYGSGERRGYAGDGERRSYGSEGGQRRSFQRPSGERRSFGSEQGRGYGSGERRSFRGDSEQRRPGFGSRPFRGGEGRGDDRRGIPGKGGKNFRKPARQAAPNKAHEGIERMISRKPVLDTDLYSDNDMISIPVKETVRLNKFIANSGICSRREADNFIQAGVVTVNGEVVTELGTKINITTDDVRFNGERLKGEAKVYIVMNKPKGFVTTSSDPHAEKTVMDLLKGCEARVFPVGRLDKNTTGVLMFTNDGEIAEKLAHPSYDKKKIYQVSLNNELKQEDFETIKSGVTLTDGEIAADELEYIDEDDHRKIGIEIHSGKNRIVRRIFESLGYEVKALDRVYFAGLTKKGIKRGGWRYLTEGEVNILKMGAYR